jgi:hypothetical protein
MNRISKRRLMSLIVLSAIGVAFVTLHFLQAQVGGGLDLSVPPLQVINTVNIDGTSSGWALYQHKYFDGAYSVVWKSSAFGGGNFSIGNIDNDGQRELAAVINYLTREERIKNRKVYYYNQKIVVFEDGCADGSSPTWESPYLGESTLTVRRNTLIADVDNDLNNEFVLVKGKHFEIYDLSGGGFIQKYESAEHSDIIFSIDAGGADNDGQSEIVLSTFNVGGPTIWKYQDGSWSRKEAQSIPPEYYGQYGLGLDYARVRDADNVVDGFGNKDNEIVGGGNNDRLMIWKYNKETGDYEWKFVSEDLGGFTQGVDAGDIDGDGQNEVVIGSCSSGQVRKTRTPARLCIFTFNGENYVLRNSFELGSTPINDVRLGDLENDGRAEIALGTSGLRIYDFIGQVGAGSIRLAYAGEGSGLEIR